MSVVGIGASAGGLQALRELLEALPARPRHAFVVLLHRTVTDGSPLLDLVASYTSMPVHLATVDTQFEPSCVYVLSAERAPIRGFEAIDLFFDRLASAYGRDAVAVVLSGAGSDGAIGALRIKQLGGRVLVQEPRSAQFDSMPMATIELGIADRVAPPAELARCLTSATVHDEGPAWSDAEAAALDEILGAIRLRADLDLDAYKAAPLLWRVTSCMRMRRVATFHDYLAMLRDDPAELDSLVGGLTIHVTEFFRDPEAWAVLEREVIPALGVTSGERLVRAWTTACATGEEAYSLAMLLAGPCGDQYQLFATDASRDVVARAGRGCFEGRALEKLSPARQTRFLQTVDGVARIRSELRERMVFAAHDLLVDVPFGTMDVITCRNLFIYLERAAVERAMDRLHGALRMGGCLMLGQGDVAPQPQSGFERVTPRYNIFRKVADRPSARASDALAASRAELGALSSELRAVNQQLARSHAHAGRMSEDLRASTLALDRQRVFLTSGAVATVFLDAAMRIRWFTPAITQLFPIIPQDVGRPLTHLVPTFRNAQFIPAVVTVIATGAPQTGELQTDSGTSFQYTVRSCADGSAVPAGVSINFADISSHVSRVAARR